MNVLAVVAHPDDEVLGLGGTLARLSQAGHAVRVVICTDRLNAELDERYHKAAELAAERLGTTPPAFLGFAIRHLHRTLHSHRLIERLEAQRDAFSPDLVLTHGPHDYHQDHRAVFEAGRIVFRPWSTGARQLECFEVPGGTSPEFVPNRFRRLGPEALARKALAWEAYRIEHRDAPHPRRWDVIQAYMTMRGGMAGLARAEATQIVWSRR